MRGDRESIELSVTPEGVERFANLSGDFNPVHVDPVIARRTLFGQPIVHGIHLMLSAIDSYFSNRKDPVRIVSAKATFHKALAVGEIALVRVARSDPGMVRLQIFNATGTRIATVTLSFVKPDAPTKWKQPNLEFERSVPDAPAPETLANLSSELALGFEPHSLRSLMPNLARVVSPYEVACFLASTRLVGMICPGLDSVFSALTLDFAEGMPDTAALQFEVSRVNLAVGSVEMTLSSSVVAGRISALIRPRPVMQPTAEALRGRVAPDVFADQKALVLGGSRGLGELAAKLLAAGGAEVLITYRIGKADADRVVSEIRSAGGIADSIKVDTASADEDLRRELPAEFRATHFYLFATPPIVGSSDGKFDIQLFRKLSEAYVGALAGCIEFLVEAGSAPLVAVMPSTVFVQDAPPNMGEYAAAKSAAELAARHITINRSNVSVLTPRLPRLPSDLTAGFGTKEYGDPVELLLSVLAEAAASGTSKPA